VSESEHCNLSAAAFKQKTKVDKSNVSARGSDSLIVGNRFLEILEDEEPSPN
jgi:hypothetical protein